jgi:spore coat protein U-like protein
MRRWLGLLAVIMLLICGAKEAAAGGSNCSVSVSLPINFGTYTGTQLQPGGTAVMVTCTLLATYTVALNAGQGTGATTTTRKMMTGGGGNTLNYQMFQNSSRTTNWGNTTGTDTVAGIGIGIAQTITIYPQLQAAQYVVPNTYNDTVTVSVTSSTGTVNTTFSVQATVQATCLISAGALSFGTYTGLQLNVASTLTITCTSATTYNVGLNAGTATGATVTTRKMTGPASAKLNYAMFRDSSRTLNWGNTVGTDTLSSTGNGSAQLSSVFGRLAAGQVVLPGAYSDTIIVTITY